MDFWNGSIPWFSGKDLKALRLHDSIEHISAHAVGKGTRTTPKGTILVLVRGMTLMKEVPVGLLHRDAAFNQDIKGIVTNDGSLDPEFLAYYLRAENQRIRNSVTVAGHGTGRLPLEALEEYPVPLPPLPEQRKISDILSTWDEALETLDALIAAKDRQKQALMQQLLTGKTRVKGAKGKWKKVQLGELAENRSDQNKGKLGTELLYGVTKADGVVPMRDHVKGESFHRCKLLEHDWFAYNPMRINIGSIARWQGNKTVMVSGDYIVFRCFEDRLSPAYLDQLRQSWMWQSFVTKGGNGSVRIRIYFSDLAEFTFPCPPLAEQQQIAAILDTADQELSLLRTQRQTLDQQKRGLMQRLLTGRIRVKTN
jgi:type I restriction enzyme S subunit